MCFGWWTSHLCDIIKPMKHSAFRTTVLVFGFLFWLPVVSWAQDAVGVLPVQFGLEGDADGRILDRDVRFDPRALLALAQENDELALQRLLLENPSPYAATRALILGLLTRNSVVFLRNYGFENGQPDPNLSGPELTALLNGPLSGADLQALAGGARLLSEPELVGAGSAAEPRQFSLISLNNELRDVGFGARQRRDISPTIHNIVALTSQRKEFFLAQWLALRFSVSGGSAGLSQLLTMVARDDGVSSANKQRLLLQELGVTASDGFSPAQYGAMYVVLKSVTSALRNQLRVIVTLKTLRPNNNPNSDIAGLYTFRQIGLLVSLDPAAMAETLEHELGHLAWDTLLNFSQQNRYRQLHAQSTEGTIDFVSNYAQTNALEDYADTFEAYMQNTVAWMARSDGNEILREKLSFVALVLSPYVFETRSDLVGLTVRKALVLFSSGLPKLSETPLWQDL